MQIRTVDKPIPRVLSNYELVAMVFSKSLNISVLGVIFVSKYIPQVIFNAVMILATFGAVFFVQSSSKPPSDKKPQKKKSSWISSVGQAIQSSVLILVCISLLSITFYILITSFWYNVVNGTAITSLFFVTFAGLCILLVVFSISFRNLMNTVLPYINILIVLFFVIMLVLLHNITPGSAIYIPASTITSISSLFLVFPAFAAISHQYTTFGKAIKKKGDTFSVMLGVVLSGVFYIILGNMAYYSEGIVNLLLHFINEDQGSLGLMSYIGYNTWHGMLFRALIALLCLVNFLGSYDDLRKKLFQRDKLTISYETLVFSLAYYITVFTASYLWGASFQTIALYIPLYFLYSIVFYFYPFTEALSKKVGWIYAIPLVILLIVSSISMLYLFFGNITLIQVISFIPSLYLRMLKTSR